MIISKSQHNAQWEIIHEMTRIKRSVHYAVNIEVSVDVFVDIVGLNPKLSIKKFHKFCGVTLAVNQRMRGLSFKILSRAESLSENDII